MSKRNAKLLLAGVIAARSTSLLFAKIGLGTISPFNLLALRFCLAFIILAVIFHKKILRTSKTELKNGAVLGGVFIIVMTAEMFALRVTESTKVSFLSNTAIVIVPLLEAIFTHQRPSGKTLICLPLTLCGVACLTLKGGTSFGIGDILGLTEAFFYACAIILTGKLSRHGDAFVTGIFQVGFIGLFALIASCLFETPRLPQGATEWGVILSLALVCSCFGFTLQPVAQRCLPDDTAAQFCAINPLNTALLGMIFLHESLGVMGFIGAALILGGILLQNLKIEDYVHGKSALRSTCAKSGN
jgi:drug/metabolite transporter (DMT)-like permease